MTSQEAIDNIKQYLEDLLAFFELNLEVDVEIHDDIVDINIPSSEVNSILIGRNAETLRSLQYILSTKLRNDNAGIYRVNLDIADYKKQRAERLAEKARGWIEEVRETGDSQVLSLNAADRRVVHQVATEFSDIKTESDGEGRNRKLIISQKSS